MAASESYPEEASREGIARRAFFESLEPDAQQLVQRADEEEAWRIYDAAQALRLEELVQESIEAGLADPRRLREMAQSADLRPRAIDLEHASLGRDIALAATSSKSSSYFVRQPLMEYASLSPAELAEQRQAVTEAVEAKKNELLDKRLSLEAKIFEIGHRFFESHPGEARWRRSWGLRKVEELCIVLRPDWQRGDPFLKISRQRGKTQSPVWFRYTCALQKPDRISGRVPEKNPQFARFPSMKRIVGVGGPYFAIPAIERVTSEREVQENLGRVVKMLEQGQVFRRVDRLR